MLNERSQRLNESLVQVYIRKSTPSNTQSVFQNSPRVSINTRSLLLRLCIKSIHLWINLNAIIKIMILCTSSLAGPVISKELSCRKLLKAKLSSPGPRNWVGVSKEQQIFRANSQKIGRLSNYNVGRDESRGGGLSEAISETFEWCKLALPLLLAMCGTYLFRGYIKENQFPVHPTTAVYASISKAAVDPNYSWKDVTNYRFQKVHTSISRLNRAVVCN